MYYFLLASNVDSKLADFIISSVNDYKNWIISFTELESYVFKIYEQNNTLEIRQATYFELITFIKFLESKKISLSQLQVIKNLSFFIRDWKCMIYNNNDFVEVSKKDTLISLRNYLARWVYDIVSNFMKIFVPDRNRYYDTFFSKIDLPINILKNKNYSELKNIYWNIAFYISDTKLNYDLSFMLDWYKKIVIKNINSEMWKWVFTFSSSKEASNFLLNHAGIWIILPYFEKFVEYRIYYLLWKNNKIKIYSVKKKNNKNLNDAFSNWKLELYKYLNVIREKVELSKIDKYFNFIEKVAKYNWHSIWVMEFIVTDENKCYLMEINHLWWLLITDNNDYKYLKQFYLDFYKININNPD